MIEISKKSEELLNQNMSIQLENCNMVKQIESLKDEIRKSSFEFENQIASVSRLELIYR